MRLANLEFISDGRHHAYDVHGGGACIQEEYAHVQSQGVVDEDEERVYRLLLNVQRVFVVYGERVNACYAFLGDLHIGVRCHEYVLYQAS